MERPVRKGTPVERMTIQQFREITTRAAAKPTVARRNKYGATRITTDDGDFDSSGEHKRYCELRLLERTGAIRDLKRQVKIPLIVNGVQLSIENKNGARRKLNYVADFTYHENGIYVVEDFKGFDTKVSRLKRAIVEAMEGIRVRITTR